MQKVSRPTVSLVERCNPDNIGSHCREPHDSVVHGPTEGTTAHFSRNKECKKGKTDIMKLEGHNMQEVSRDSVTSLEVFPWYTLKDPISF